MRTLSARILLGFALLAIAFVAMTVNVAVNLTQVEKSIHAISVGHLPLALAANGLATARKRSRCGALPDWRRSDGRRPPCSRPRGLRVGFPSSRRPAGMAGPAMTAPAPKRPLAGLPAAVEQSARAFSYETGAGAVFAQAVAVEAPIAIRYGGQPFAVMMATPADLEDFAFGFSLTEGIVARSEEIRAVEVSFDGDSARLDIALAGESLRAVLARRRTLPGRTGCGVCGVEDLKHLPGVAKVVAGPEIAPRAIGAAVAALEGRQPLNALTRAAHGAAWASAATGEILLLREDVGRHNALDKCIGALLRQGYNSNDGFLLITSRCSHEMVVKASKLGASTLVSVSAPTTMALRQAEEAGVRLIAVARADHALAFPTPGRGGLA